MPTYGEELELAEHALEAEDYEHALHHACGALALRPNAPEAKALVTALSEHVDVGAVLAKDEFAGAFAARALVLADAGKIQDACAIVADLARAMPHRGYEHWLAEWAPRIEGKSIDVRTVIGVLASALAIAMGRLRLLPTEREVVLPFSRFAVALTRTREGNEHAQLHSLASGLARRAGDLDTAIALAERAIELGARDLGGVARGLALRVAGRYEDADEAFESVRAELDDPLMYVERARAMADARRYADARALLDRGPSTDDDAEIRETRRWLDACVAGDEEARARTLDDIRRSATHGDIPLPSDAGANVIARTEDGAAITGMATSCLEAPSVRLCLALAFADGDVDRVPYSFNDVATPDPRSPWKEPVFVEPWRRDGDHCVPALAPPDEDTARAIRELATSPPDLTRWWTRAGELAERLGPSAQDALLGALVHPPIRGVPNAELVGTMFRAQVAATLLLVRIDDGAWADSRRREVLLSLIRGPQDWITAAAVLVATELALHEPAAFPELRDEIADLAHHTPDRGHVTFLWPLAYASQRLPCFSREASEEIAGLMREMYGDEEPQPAEGGEPSSPAQPSSGNPILWSALVLGGLVLIVLVAMQCT